MRLRLVLAAAIALLWGAAPAPASAIASPPQNPAAAEFRYPSLFPQAPTVGTPARHIEVSLAGQQLIAFEGPTPVRAFDVATGDFEHPTPVGHFTIQEKFDRIDLIGRDYYYHDVPYVMRLIRPFYIHAAPWREEFGLATSRGCVTLATADAGWLYTWAEVGTPVNIHRQ
jgi:lipoprotein-anchoring transpeptidase ErfK/SrfK